MLEILSHFGGLATHSYRDMPLVVAPLLWNALSKSFRKPAELKERAHGDGMSIGYDSPEAFEEILWRLFWPEKYKRDRIELWQAGDDADEFGKFFLTHIQKIINLRGDGHPDQSRYLSKNNANIARIPLLRRLFPNGLLVVPFRKPLDHARSLLNQHRRFLELHKVDSFSRRYMDDI